MNSYIAPLLPASLHNLNLMKLAFALCLILCLGNSVLFAQTTQFTYQGRLTDAGLPANGNFDLQFKLFDALSGGAQVGTTNNATSVAVSAGVFTVTLDFGAAAFPGANRWLEISVRPTGGAAFTTLTPRQPVLATPYTIKSLNATAADGLSVACVGCVTSNQIGGLPTGNGSYIQNSTSQQATANFNISGNGTAGGTLSSNIVNATTQYNLGGSRVLHNTGTNNFFAGVGAANLTTTGNSNAFFGTNAGQANTTGSFNAFFGKDAGLANTTGNSNAFFGVFAGDSNTTGGANSFFGAAAGTTNTTGISNAFFGTNAGHDNTTGISNAFFGRDAGFANTTAANNSFFGYAAGASNTTGTNNSFFGAEAGINTTTGSSNAFFGQSAGYFNTTGDNNAFFGLQAGLKNTTASNNSFFGTWAAYNNTTGSNNAFFGRSAGYANTTGHQNAFFGFQAGVNNTVGYYNTFLGEGAGNANSTGFQNLFDGAAAGSNNTTGFNNTFVGTFAGTDNVTGSSNIAIGVSTKVGTNLTNATAIGAGALVGCNNCMVLGGVNGVNGVSGDVYVGIGTTNPTAKLEVVGTTKTQVIQITGGSDLSEQFEISAAAEAASLTSPPIQPGLLVSIDPHHPGKLVVSRQSYDRKVAGIISGAGGVNPGMLMGQAGTLADGAHPVALTGRVYCWADASNGPIEPGDLLTTSSLPGYAMKVTNHAKAQGAIIGKAMTGLSKGRGLILVLVTLQ